MTDPSHLRAVGDKAPLSRKSGSAHREDSDVVAGIQRQIRAVGRRLAEADPDELELLRRLEGELALAWRVAVAGLRRSGYSDAAIGEVLGTTKQAVQQRWPRTDDHLYP